MTLRLYQIQDSYIEHCMLLDAGVTRSKEAHEKFDRKYVGIIMEINGFSYFAPLSSSKVKHETMRESIDFIKIEDENGLYAVLNLNNMIPVPSIAVINLDISDEQDVKYRDLLKKEREIILSKKDKIIKNAENLYEKVAIQKNTRLSERCCDFKLLETKIPSYQSFIIESTKEEIERVLKETASVVE